MKARIVDLTTICGGGLPEMFQREMDDVMKNIADPNTDPNKPRQIKMVVDIYPSQDRQTCRLAVGVTSKTLPVARMGGSLFISNQNGVLQAYSTDIRQQDIFAEDEAGESAEPETKKPVPYALKDVK